MAEPSRGLQISRRGWLLAGLAAPLFRARAADSLIVTFDGDNLRVSSLGVHFLQGKSLSRVKAGSTVVYVATLTLFRDAFVSPIKRSEFKFAVSYDVLGIGDQFQVLAQGPPQRKAVNLSQSATETWCFENVVMAMQGFPPDRPFWLQLDVRTALPKLTSVFGESGLFLDIVEFLTPGSDERQNFPTGPLRLEDLIRTTRKGRAG